MTQAFIIDAVRSPRGRGSDKGALKDIKPVDLLAQQLKALQQRTGIDTAEVCDGLFGCVTQTADQGANIGKLAMVRAGWSDAASGLTLNRYCASGLTAVQFAAAQALANDGLAVAGGIEMMSRVPMASDKGPLTHDLEFQRQTTLVPIGIAADAIATIEGFTREQCDEYALQSQQRAVAAREQGHFRSIIAVENAAGEAVLAQDETPRASTTLESLSSLAPAFAEMGAKYGVDALLCKQYGLSGIDHVQHAGNSPTMADGAAAVLVASPAAVERLGLKPRARILASADASVDHVLALTGAADATQKALQRAGLTVDDIDLFEVNESFAALMLHYMKHLNVAHEKLNVNGGAIALGHAMGSTGSTLVGMALDELERRNLRRAVVAICGAAGVAVAMVIERVGAA
ncbi:acetyl-CoA C-acyltransferase [Comamonas thiooxydans]|uniref:acetyl-CoA C-acyltransferase n=1 Tax=Comamonas thiooxydans TaxID=363952 RepID=UPI00209C251A|nr:acetyl-CoA C-acyltransferase [Comamonas thiooxydans]MCO8251172.1 acetyl-CoA C-acyltransferase [Comamonas thiooxydans]